MKAKPAVTVVPADGEEPIAVEIIEQSIVEIAKGMRAINNTRLTRKALVLLIHHSSKVSQRDVEAVLNSLGALEAVYLKRHE